MKKNHNSEIYENENYANGLSKIFCMHGYNVTSVQNDCDVFCAINSATSIKFGMVCIIIVLYFIKLTVQPV